MLGISNLLLNIFIILLCIFVYFGISGKINPKYKKALISILLSIASVFCMTFPFTVFPGHIYDLRIIAILISILYGGYGVGSVVTLISFIYRYFLGGTGFIYMLVTFPPFLAIAFYLSKQFENYSRKKKILVGVALDFLMVSINIIFLFQFNHLTDDQVLFFINYSFSHALGMSMAIYLIEIMYENEMMHIKMQKTEKNQVLGELAASFAHEIRNPLTTTLGFAQLLKKQESDEKKIKYVDLIISESKRAESIITEYLSFAKPQMNTTETVLVSGLIQKVTEITYSYAVNKNVEIRSTIDDSLEIVTDSKKLIQVLINIIKNGIEAMNMGGILTIDGYKENSQVVIKISDTGKGMSKDQIHRLGNPYYSTKEKGTGLGMMIVYRYLELMNGKIHVESEPGKGTQFTLVFPAGVQVIN